LRPKRRCRRQREVRLAEGLERSERLVADLVEAELADVLEPVFAEVADISRINELSRRLREEDLPAVARSRDSGSAVDVDADVTFFGQDRLARVDSDARTDRALGSQRSLRIDRGCERVGRLLEGDGRSSQARCCSAKRSRCRPTVAGHRGSGFGPVAVTSRCGTHRRRG